MGRLLSAIVGRAGIIVVLLLAVAFTGGCASPPEAPPAPLASKQDPNCRPDAVDPAFLDRMQAGDKAVYEGWREADGMRLRTRLVDTYLGVRNLLGPEGLMQVWEWTSTEDAVLDGSYFRMNSRTHSDACGLVQWLEAGVSNTRGEVLTWEARNECHGRQWTSNATGFTKPAQGTWWRDSCELLSDWAERATFIINTTTVALESVTVPAGTFTSWHYREESSLGPDRVLSEYWTADHPCEWTLRSQGPITQRELSDYGCKATGRANPPSMRGFMQCDERGCYDDIGPTPAKV